MPTSPSNPEITNTQKRICDFCSESTALLYCRADSAKLCLSCDREVHSTNQLFTKHTRFQLCDNCDSSCASILCVTERSVLCQNCDFELHDSVHGSCDRRPLEGFSGCPSASEIAVNFGFESFDAKCWSGEEEKKEGFKGGFLSGLEEDESDEFLDLFVWETPTVVSIDDLIDSTGKSHNFQAMVAPPLPKDRNLSCGQHKHEMLNQLHKLAKLEGNIKQDFNPLPRVHNLDDENEEDLWVEHMFRAYQHDEEYVTLQGHEARSYAQGNNTGDAVNESPLLGDYVEEGFLNLDKQSSICSGENLATIKLNSHNPVLTDTPTLHPKVSTHEFSAAGRDSALSRYKEKKRTRRYDKKIRYESRKVQAEHRKRVKGRFAKLGQSLNQA